jgi:hypothetical protein
MKAWVLGFLLLSSLTLSAQVDRSQLNGTWCLIEVLDAWSIDEPITKEELVEFNLDIANTRFYINKDNLFIAVSEGSTVEEAIDDAMIMVAGNESNVFNLSNESLEMNFKMEVIKNLKTEFIFKLYDDSFGMILSCRRC